MKHLKKGLSSRQKQIMQALALGKTRLQVSVELGISMATVKTQLKRVFKFLGAINAVEAVVLWKANEIDRDVGLAGQHHFQIMNGFSRSG